MIFLRLTILNLLASAIFFLLLISHTPPYFLIFFSLFLVVIFLSLYHNCIKELYSFFFLFLTLLTHATKYVSCTYSKTPVLAGLGIRGFAYSRLEFFPLLCYSRCTCFAGSRFWKIFSYNYLVINFCVSFIFSSIEYKDFLFINCLFMNLL